MLTNSVSAGLDPTLVNSRLRSMSLSSLDSPPPPPARSSNSNFRQLKSPTKQQTSHRNSLTSPLHFLELQGENNQMGNLTNSEAAYLKRLESQEKNFDVEKLRSLLQFERRKVLLLTKEVNNLKSQHVTQQTIAEREEEHRVNIMLSRMEKDKEGLRLSGSGIGGGNNDRETM